MSQAPDLTLAQLLDQPWTRRLARAASFLVVIGLGGVSGYFFSLGSRITAIETDRTKRIIQSDQNTQVLQSQVFDLQSGMDKVRTDVSTLKIDLAEVKGILKQMQREQVAVSAPLDVRPTPPQEQPQGPIALPLLSVVRQR